MVTPDRFNDASASSTYHEQMAVGQLDGFTLLFEALVLMLAQQMPFAAGARIVNLSWRTEPSGKRTCGTCS
ncbi:hypothetical protein R75461_07171 [Paraburkholderia nemoris]|nr:hypothetical protein R75461_07171 [Paraburkholderia nemoris]